MQTFSFIYLASLAALTLAVPVVPRDNNLDTTDASSTNINENWNELTSVQIEENVLSKIPCTESKKHYKRSNFNDSPVSIDEEWEETDVDVDFNVVDVDTTDYYVTAPDNKPYPLPQPAYPKPQPAYPQPPSYPKPPQTRPQPAFTRPFRPVQAPAKRDAYSGSGWNHKTPIDVPESVNVNVNENTNILKDFSKRDNYADSSVTESSAYYGEPSVNINENTNTNTNVQSSIHKRNVLDLIERSENINTQRKHFD